MTAGSTPTRDGATAYDDHDYPLSEVLRASRATVKPDARVKCRRCPNATWITDLRIKIVTQGKDAGETDYGDDEVLRAECAALTTKWVWPQFNVTDCDARRKAILAERPD
jgi:hypothetical protein